MRRDVLTLREFYASPLGRAAAAMISARMREGWGDAAGLDVLGLGYATPYIEPLRRTARRAVACMPAAQGVEVWPGEGGVAACLSHEAALPFRNALFDRILMVHSLEESDDPLAALRDVWRVLAPAGRVMVVAANRRGPWSNAEATPFGHGRPFTRRQLEALVREAELEPVAWSRALYVPPWTWAARWAEGFEQAGSVAYPMMSGVILMEAVKQTFAVRPKGLAAPARVFVPRALRPQAAARAPQTQAPVRQTLRPAVGQGLDGGGKRP